MAAKSLFNLARDASLEAATIPSSLVFKVISRGAKSVTETAVIPDSEYEHTNVESNLCFAGSSVPKSKLLNTGSSEQWNMWPLCGQAGNRIAAY